ncbi:class I SAM-dependent DNA methyltransferase [Jeotgalibacillus sp. ET6]|uniref:class I SAM-dependent DNA methyltransferase n=1 Tax=Jeotgalibacillus sp. ET6 TaxID=3037260 RepID=UPI0024186D43|nr:DNA methyltransferase [Jeotgalibacillus sp. ET6]MDG5473917.1 class I SAM-dependent DNA methyltransferase [Jeotgalibacillus sp. ET6]
MAMLSWNEIRSRAIKFSSEWKEVSDEDAEAKSFWDDFFNVFGVSRRRTAAFEKRVKKIDGKNGFIDLLWKGTLLVEHKSKGKDLKKAFDQARDYFPGLKDSELPKYILVSDFENFVLYDLEDGGRRSFTLNNFHQHIELFGFMAGYQKQEFKEQDPVNIKAAEKMGELHRKLKDIGYTGHNLEIYLTRILFCLFADDTGIFEKNLFRDLIEQGTREDGRDLALHIQNVFQILNTPRNKRLSIIDELSDRFPYVNGGLFEENLSLASFDSEMRELLLECSILDWGKISPAIFGSLFQAVMNPDQRRELGAHYTSEENILKVIKSLFLDELWEEFESVKKNSKKLEGFHKKLSTLKFFDPACGCGNFLILAYRELRLLELEILREQLKDKMVLEIDLLVWIDVDQFYGIEIDDFSAQVASVALWLMDHQMNMEISNEFGEYFVRLPLTKKPNIYQANALNVDWNEIIDKKELSYIIGNPPFVGSSLMNEQQKKDLKPITEVIKKSGALDYVAGWYVKASEYIQSTKIKVGLVSTNSIIQGEQAIVLWKYLFYTKRITIHFAHQTFKWTNEAKGKAAVFCVIIGFSNLIDLNKTLYTYPDISGSPTVSKPKNINQYLLDAPTAFIDVRSKPISDVEPMLYGSKPVDGGYYLYTNEEKEAFIRQEPLSSAYFRKWVGARELISGKNRYVLYLKNCPPNELRKMPLVQERISAVREMRLNSKKASTRQWADFPTHFTEDRVIENKMLIIPRVTSENRKIIPIGYFDSNTICSDAAFQIEDDTKYIFGILNSNMHMVWMRTVSGRLKSDYRYSNTIVYNNFVFPEASEKKKIEIQKISEDILNIREKYMETGSTLDDLYHNLTMPKDLMRAHQTLDKSIEKLYGKKFKSDNDRVEFLFKLYLEKVLEKDTKT